MPARACSGVGAGPGGDVFLGLGLYEQRRKQLLLHRQQEYREHLLKQNQLNAAKKLSHLEAQARKRMSGESQQLQQQEQQRHEEKLRQEEQLYNRAARRPSSVAVQTDPQTMYWSPAERELSPRRSHSQPQQQQQQQQLHHSSNTSNTSNKQQQHTETDDNNNLSLTQHIANLESPRARLLRDLRHTHMPVGLFDADVIRERNLRTEKELSARQLQYQQELKQQIHEQQRLRQERRDREKQLEQAESLRLQQQLEQLRQEAHRELHRQTQLTQRMQQDAAEFHRRRLQLQADIEAERRTLRELKRTSPASLQPSITGESAGSGSRLVGRDVPPRYEPAFLRRPLPLEDSLPIPVLRSPPPLQPDPEGGTRSLSRNMQELQARWQVPAVQKSYMKPPSVSGSSGEQVGGAVTLSSRHSVLTQLGAIRRQLQLEQLKLDHHHRH